MNQDKRLNLSEQPVRAVQSVGAPAVGTVTGEIADLNSALTGKANASHAHTTADVTGLETRLAALESAPPPASSPSAHYLLPLPSGSYFDQAINAVAKSTIAAAANRIDLIPFVPGVAVTLQTIGIEVSTAVASAQARVGVYADVGGLPDALLADSDLLDCSATGVKLGSVALTLAAGVRYWLAVHSSSTQTYRGVPVAALLSLGVPAAGGTTSYTLWRSTSTFASGLPSSGPSGTLTSAIAPVVIMRPA